MKRLRVVPGVLLWAAAALWPAGAAAQGGEPARGQNEVFVGSELEEYLRFLHAGGAAAPYPWSVRAFSPAEVDRLLPADSVHPWAARYPLRPDSAAGLRVDWVRPRATAVFNSAFPSGGNDGPVWAGRGLTTAFQAGVSARYGPVSLTLAPIVFRAENASFPLVPNGESGPLVYADRWLPTEIDLPQRFGDEPYARVDPGQSTLRVDAGGVAVGVSTANQQWGPATEYPLILGNNAAGFPHAFAGTARPVDLWIGRLHGRLVWGRLDGSEYAPAHPDSTLRFMSGLVAVFTPRGIPGLEIGGSRFFHSPWPAGGPGAEDFARPIQKLFKVGLQDDGQGQDGRSEVDNQLGSLFMRWAFPGSGFEVYGEYAREDHSWDMRDFLLEPDQNSAFMVGFRHGWRRTPTQLLTLRGELLSSRASHLSRVRPQAPFYKHNIHGHTLRGQILGSPAAYGGGGAILAADYYHPGGRWTVEWTRTQNDPLATWVVSSDGPDVTHALGAETLLFLGRWDVTAGATGAYNFNRNRLSDEFNLRLVLGVRADL